MVDLEEAMKPRWSRLSLFGFRFAFVYFWLYALPFPINQVPNPRFLSEDDGFVWVAWEKLALWGAQAARWVHEGWNVAVPWVADRLGLDDVEPAFSGSGDRLFNWVQDGMRVSAALLVAIVWMLMARRTDLHHRLGRLLRDSARYYVALFMFGYGFVKVIKLQFGDPPLYWMAQSLGDMSPMRLAWAFMGQSDLYCWFAGAAEVLAGVLLLFRRTMTLGGLLCAGVMVNVALMNFGFDIPVKLFSVHLAVFGAAIALSDRRVIDVFVRNRWVDAQNQAPPFRSPLIDGVRCAVKLGFIGLVVHGHVTQGLDAAAARAERPALYGVWDLRELQVDGASLPLLVTESERLRRVIIDTPRHVTLQTMGGSYVRYDAEVTDAEIRFLDEDREVKATWVVRRPDERTLELEGELDGRAYALRAALRTRDEFLLANRGFHLVNEVPFNR